MQFEEPITELPENPNTLLNATLDQILGELAAENRNTRNQRDVIVSSAKSRIRELLNRVLNASAIGVDPLKWWCNLIDSNSKQIATPALEVLSIPATSAPIERVFSQAGLATARHRNRTSFELLNSQLVFYCNIECLERSKKSILPQDIPFYIRMFATGTSLNYAASSTHAKICCAFTTPGINSTRQKINSAFNSTVASNYWYPACGTVAVTEGVGQTNLVINRNDPLAAMSLVDDATSALQKPNELPDISIRKSPNKIRCEDKSKLIKKSRTHTKDMKQCDPKAKDFALLDYRTKGKRARPYSKEPPKPQNAYSQQGAASSMKTVIYGSSAHNPPAKLSDVIVGSAQTLERWKISNIQLPPNVHNVSHPEVLKANPLGSSSNKDDFDKMRKKLNRQLHDTVEILEDSTGHSYASIFKKYLRVSDEGAQLTTVDIEDPFIMRHHQILNFAAFCEMLVSRVESLKRIMLTTKQDHEDKAGQAKSLAELTRSLLQHDVSLTIGYKDFHDRMIRFDNGYAIQIGRGLDIYKFQSKYTIGFQLQKLRKCKKTTIHVYREY
uniref:HAT C-terminal dimerisation domain-containing protein n=2 Tax=Ditylenchus dipsaci TaxID=166011 RepID=A0A915DWV9_9BILA